MIRSFCGLAGLLLLVVIVGCGKSETTGGDSPAPNPMGGPSGGGPSTGNAVFDRNCSNCHSINAPDGGGPKRKGPNLSKVGATRSKDWLAEHIKNPAAHKPGSTMPAFEQKLSADEIKSVSDFMAGLK